jgi:hypothetical protein
MVDVMKELFGGDTDHDAARKFAEKVAALANSRVLSPELTKIIGVEVFRLPRSPEDAVDLAFTPKLVRILRRIQFNRVQRFLFSPVHLDVVASLDSPEFCVGQALVFQELMALANRQAYERNKDLLG